MFGASILCLSNHVGRWLAPAKVTLQDLPQGGPGRGCRCQAPLRGPGIDVLPHPREHATRPCSTPGSVLCGCSGMWGVSRRPVEERDWGPMWWKMLAKRKENLALRKCSWKETKLPGLPLEIALFKMQSADVFR